MKGTAEPWGRGDLGDQLVYFPFYPEEKLRPEKERSLHSQAETGLDGGPVLLTPGVPASILGGSCTGTEAASLNPVHHSGLTQATGAPGCWIIPLVCSSS